MDRKKQESKADKRGKKKFKDVEQVLKSERETSNNFDLSNLKSETKKIQDVKTPPVSHHDQDLWTKYDVLAAKAPTETKSDFELLLHAPKSSGGHFQFKSEKNWEENERRKNENTSDIFNLDLNVLNGGLSCIPFYKRIGLSVENMSTEDITRCDSNARINQEQYRIIEESFRKLLENKLNKHIKSEKISTTQSREDNFSNLDMNVNLKSDFVDLSEVKDNKISVIDKISVDNVCADKTVTIDENLEDWLDNILDD